MRLSRRTLLRGLGAAVSLPFLEAMLPARGALAANAAPPRRLAFLYLPNGIMPEHFLPVGTGASWQASRVLVPLEPWRSDVLVLSGLDNIPNNQADAHGTMMAGVLTGEDVRNDRIFGAQEGQSIDQLIADRLRGATPYSSLELTSEASVGCFGTPQCAFLQNISYRSGRVPVPRDYDPRALFERLFGDQVDVGDPAVALRRRRDLLVVDAVAEDAARLRERLGRTDRTVLEEFLDTLFEVERQIVGAPTDATCAADVSATLPPDVLVPPFTISEHAEIMTDLLALAFRCDLTRVASWQLANEVSRRTYPELGVLEQHHRASHHGGDPALIEAIGKIGTWEMGFVARTIGRLAELKEFDGSRLLDHVGVLAFSSMSDPDPHSEHDLPVVLAGAMGGVIRPGRHLAFEDRPFADLLMALASGMGVDLSTFGAEGASPIELS